MNKRQVESIRRTSLSKGIYLALASMMAMPLLSGTAHAACTTAGVTITCATGSNTNNVASSTDAVTMTVQTGAVLSVPPLLGGSALTLSGNGINLDNSGTIDPALNGGLSLAASGAVLGNNTVGGNTINVHNLAGGNINGLVNALSLLSIGGQSLTVQNATGGVTNITNDGTFGMQILGLNGFTTADAPTILTYGGGQTNFTNSAGKSITGRIGFGASNTPGAGNTFINAGTINGSLYMGDTPTGNTFTAVSGSSVVNNGISLNAVILTLNISLAGAGIVDGGLGANNLLVLQNSATGTGAGTGGAVSTINAANYLHFQHLVVNSGTWNLQGAAVTNDATINDGLVNFDNAGVFGSQPMTARGGAIAASTPGLSLANAINLTSGRLELAGTNAFGLGGVISGAGGLTVTDTAVITLGGANLFTGGVNLNAGGLLLGNAGALGTGALTVGGNATLDTTAAFNLANGVVVNGGATLNLLGNQAVTLNGALS